MRRIMMLLAVAAMMAVLVAASAAPTFAVPEDFPPGVGPSADAVDGLLKAESKSKTRSGTHDIVITKLIDKASSTIF